MIKLEFQRLSCGAARQEAKKKKLLEEFVFFEEVFRGQTNQI